MRQESPQNFFKNPFSTPCNKKPMLISRYNQHLEDRFSSNRKISNNSRSMSIKKVQPRSKAPTNIYYTKTQESESKIELSQIDPKLKNNHQYLLKTIANRKRIYKQSYTQTTHSSEKSVLYVPKHTNNFKQAIETLNDIHIPQQPMNNISSFFSPQKKNENEEDSIDMTNQLHRIQPNKRIFLCKLCLEYFEIIQIHSHMNYCGYKFVGSISYSEKWNKLKMLLEIIGDRYQSVEYKVLANYMTSMKINQKKEHFFKNNLKFIRTPKQKKNQLEPIKWVIDKIPNEQILNKEELFWLIQELWNKNRA